MAEDVTVPHARHLAAIQMQIAAADGGGRDFEDDVVRVQQYRIGNVVHAHVVRAVPCQCLHDACVIVWRHRAASERAPTARGFPPALPVHMVGALIASLPETCEGVGVHAGREQASCQRFGWRRHARTALIQACAWAHCGARLCNSHPNPCRTEPAPRAAANPCTRASACRCRQCVIGHIDLYGRCRHSGLRASRP